MIVKVVVPDSIYAQVYFARGEQGAIGPTGNTGPQGPSGIVNVDSPITNSGTSTAANIGINQALLQIAPAQVTGTAVITTDSRLSDQRVPTAGSVTDAKIVAGGLSTSAITGTAVITTDSRLSDARTPTAHAATHGSAGTDPVTLAQSQVTNLVTDLAAKAPTASPTFTGTVTIPVTSGVFLGTNALGEIYKVGSAPGLGYVPYTAAVAQGIAWQALSDLAKVSGGNSFTGAQSITGTSDAVQLLVKGNSTQTNVLQEWRNSSNTLLGSMSNGGIFYAAGNGTFGTATSLARITAQIGTASNIGVIVKGAASQTGNLQEWRNSADSILSRVNSSGNFLMPSLVVNYDAQITAGAATVVPLLVKGAASQSANLQEWQNSAGTVLTRVESTGNLVVPGTTGALSSGTFILGSRNSGGELTLVRETAATSNPGANLARIYFRDGTNAGTLKLVVRAGAAGAETTILDNIPQ